MAVDLARVAQVYAAGESGSLTGSGYIVGEGLILTAAHVVTGAGLVVGAGVEVSGLGSPQWVPARVVWLDSELDAALLRESGPQARPERSPTVLRWGRLAGSTPVSATAVGFPWAQERP